MLCNEILFGNSIRRPSGYQLKRGYYHSQTNFWSYSPHAELHHIISGNLTWRINKREIYGDKMEEFSQWSCYRSGSNINLEVHTED
ncbi:hypothetical protein SUGI_1126220 [Cryptomeria japonica]|nr:hypothetical protein SUGI_1126220 [Cryptomeria japonica]